MSNQKTALIILDGWGHGPDDPAVNAIHQARTPFVDSLYEAYPNAELHTSGEDVGLPDGQMGNSEVGHLNIGAGRVVDQPLVRINKAIANDTLYQNKPLLDAIQYARQQQRSIHLLGLVSDGGVHAHIDHLKALLDILEYHQAEQVFVHGFTDGRDTDPKSGIGHIQSLQQHLAGTRARLASIIGRYYAMDRDNRWERIRKAYQLLTQGEGDCYQDPVQAVMDAYEADNTDEFIEPVAITDEDQQPLTTISEGDVVIFFNFRTDRGRELTTALSQQDFPDYGMTKLDLRYLTMTAYDKTFEGVDIIFGDNVPEQTLGEVVADQGLSQLRIAETEKYPHVTYFFSGGREGHFDHEQREMVASPQVPTYDFQPAMSAQPLNDTLQDAVNTNAPDLIVLNYANPDMVGHTGDFGAVIEALETVDQCLRETVNFLQQNSYACLVIADHGNADYMVNPDGSPNTAHTKNPVPVFLLDEGNEQQIRSGRLADVAPTLLELMGCRKPEAMSGQSLMIQQS